MGDQARIQQVQSLLTETGASFGLPRPIPPVLRWGLLFGALAPWDERYVTALELMYEGYLLHYREGRVVAAAPGDREAALLAGDVFYARGLRLIAGAGHVETVLLLTRLMSTCSYLRSVDAPFAADDVLWASTTAGLVALVNGVPCRDVCALFDEIDAALWRSASIDIAALATRAAPRLRLAYPAPLLAEIAAARGGAIVRSETISNDRR
jgi:hypothetical protein